MIMVIMKYLIQFIISSYQVTTEFVPASFKNLITDSSKDVAGIDINFRPTFFLLLSQRSVLFFVQRINRMHCISNPERRRRNFFFIIFLKKPVFVADVDKLRQHEEIAKLTFLFARHELTLVLALRKVKWNIVNPNPRMTCCELMLSNVLRAAPERNKFLKQSDMFWVVQAFCSVHVKCLWESKWRLQDILPTKSYCFRCMWQNNRFTYKTF